LKSAARTRLELLGVAAPAALAIGWIFWSLNDFEERLTHALIDARASATAHQVEVRVDQCLRAVAAVRGYISAAPPTDPSGFRAFLSSANLIDSDVIGIGWNPRVTDAERAEFERRARAFDPGFEIRVRDPELGAMRAPRRDVYFPTLYGVPPPPTQGIDSGSVASLRDLLERARDTGNPQISAPFALLAPSPNSAVVVVFTPVYRGVPTSLDARRAQLLGYVGGALKVGSLVASFQGEDRALDMEIWDETEPTQPQVLFSPEPQGRSRGAGEPVVVELSIPGRHWVARFRATPRLIRSASSLSSFPLAGGAVASLFFIVLLVQRYVAIVRHAREISAHSEEMRRAMHRFESVIESSPSGVLMVDSGGTIRLSNARIDAMFGYERSALLGQPVDLLVPPSIRGNHAALRDSFFAKPEMRWLGVGRELYGTHRSGRLFPVEVGLAPLHAEEGPMVLATIVDVTERKRAAERLEQHQQELRRSNAELEQFAYVASHDLQEPLRKVASFCTLIERKYGDRLDDEGRTYIRFAVDGAARMRALIQDLLAFSRAGSGELRTTPVRSEMALRAALDALSTQIDESHARISFEALPTVMAEPTQLTQLFQNLLSNAIKYRSHATPEIHVRCVEQARHWVISVSDNGIGIAPAFHERVFGVFKRLHTREKYSGTGIGLAICRRVVERFGGRIWVESQEGAGATFHFSLPRAVAGQEKDEAQSSEGGAHVG